MFHNTNPTNKYIVAIDNDIAILCDSKIDALEIYNQVSSIEESAFGAMRFIAPNEIDTNIYGEIATISILEGRKTANKDYIRKHTERCNKKYSSRKDVLATTNIRDRLKEAKTDYYAAIFRTESTVDWRKNRIKVV